MTSRSTSGKCRAPRLQIDIDFDTKVASAADQARQAERHEFDGIWCPEGANDPFLSIALGAAATERIELGTGIAVAFARSPMTVAQTAWDLQSLSGGRFLLGLGSQIKPHIERRFSMPWSRPAARMREYVAALRAIWSCWQTGTPLEFDGDFYTHNLMPPHFDPGPLPSGPPAVWVAAVGEAMTRVAAETADGVLLHRFTTARYLREITTPLIEGGLLARDRSEFQICYPAFVVAGDTEAELAKVDVATRGQLAFYASTPAYRPVLELHGWGDLQTELRALTQQGRWTEMGGLIEDAMLDEFAVIGTPEECGQKLHARYAGLIDRLELTAVTEVRPEVQLRVAQAVRAVASERVVESEARTNS